MKRYVKLSEDVLGMANLTPKRTGISAQIWSDHRGIARNKKDRKPRIKIGNNEGYSASISIEPSPEILAMSAKLRRSKQGSSEWDMINEGIKYVADNFDLFLKHFNDLDDSYDDDDLKEDLRKRGYYK